MVSAAVPPPRSGIDIEIVPTRVPPTVGAIVAGGAVVPAKVPPTMVAGGAVDPAKVPPTVGAIVAGGAVDPARVPPTIVAGGAVDPTKVPPTVGAIVAGGAVVPVRVPPTVGAIVVVPAPNPNEMLSGWKILGTPSMEADSNRFSPTVSCTACWNNNIDSVHPLLLSDLPDLDLEDLQFVFDAFDDGDAVTVIVVARRTNE